MIRSFVLIVTIFILAGTQYGRAEAPNEAAKPGKLAVFQGYVGQNNAFTQSIYDPVARAAMGPNLIKAAKKSEADAIKYFVETVDYQSAVMFTFTPSTASVFKMRIDVFVRNPASAECEAHEMLVMDIVDRFGKCYNSVGDIYLKEAFFKGTVQPSEMGQKLKNSSEYLIAVRGLSADVAVSAFQMDSALSKLRDRIFFLGEHLESDSLAKVLLEANGYVVDLREVFMWKTNSSNGKPMAAIMILAAADYLEKRGLVFIDSSHRCPQGNGPRFTLPVNMNLCVHQRKNHDPVRELKSLLEKAGARWSPSQLSWVQVKQRNR